jgi:hypothetical protein
MTNKMTDPFSPWDESGHARDLEQNDQFNRLTDDTILVRGGLRTRLEELAASGNREVIAVLEENGVDDPRIPKTFYLSDGQAATIYGDSEGWHSVLVIDGQQHRFTAPERDRVMFLAEEASAKHRQARSLTESELIRVARLTQAGETIEAIELFVALSLDGKDRRSEREILEDPKYKHLLNTAATTIWKFSRQDYVPDDEFEALLQRAASIKPLTLRIIDALYDKYQDQKSEAARAKRHAAPPAAPETEPIVTEEDLDRLSDDGVAKLHSAIVKNRARHVSRIDRTTLGR